MAKTMYLINVDASTHRGVNTPNLAGTSSWAFPKRLDESRGSASTNATVTSVAGPTNGIEVQAGGVMAEWISEPLSADFTIAGTITVNLWAFEATMNDNVASNAVVYRLDGATGALTQIAKSANVTEVAVTTAAVQNFTVTPTSTACKRGDRILVRVFGDDAGTMAAGGSLTFSYSGPTAAATGDSWIQFTENLTFVPAGDPQILLIQSVADTVHNVGASAAVEMALSQPFVAQSSSLASVTLNIAKVGAPTDNYIIEVQTDNGSGLPSGTVVGTVATIAGTSLTTTQTVTTWASLSISLTIGTTYHIVARRSSGVADISNYYRLYCAGSTQAGWSKLCALNSGTWQVSANGAVNITLAFPGIVLSQLVRDARWNVGDGTSFLFAQPFIAQGPTLTSASAWLGKFGIPSDNLIIEIQSDNAGHPSGTVLGTLATIVAGAGLSASPTVTQFTWPTAIPVTKNSTYHIVFRRSGAQNGTDNYNIGVTLTSQSGWSDAQRDLTGSGGWASTTGSSGPLTVSFIFGMVYYLKDGVSSPGSSAAVASPTLLTSFTGADETPLSDGGKWALINSSNTATLKRISNAIAATTDGTQGTMYYNVADFGPDLEMYGTLANWTGASGGLGMHFRIQQAGGAATNDGYFVQLAGVGSTTIFKVTNGSPSTVQGSKVLTWANGDKLGVKISGNTIWVFRQPSGSGNWNLLNSYTDISNTYPLAGKIGIMMQNGADRFDDLYVGTNTNVMPVVPGVVTSFTGADENPLSEGSTWANLNSAASPLKRLSNAAVSSIAGIGASYFLPDLSANSNFGPDLEATCTFGAQGAGVYSGICFRISFEGGSNTWSGYFVGAQQSTNLITIFSVGGGAYTSLVNYANQSGVWATGDKLGIRCAGSMISVYRLPSGSSTWEFLGEFADSAFANAGKVGLRSDFTNNEIKDFAVGTGTNLFGMPAATTRGSASVTKVQGRTAAGNVSPILLGEWYTPQLNTFTLGGKAKFNLRAFESNALATTSLRAEIAIVNPDGSGAIVWGSANNEATASGDKRGEIGTSDTAYNVWVAGADTTVAANDRLRFRVYADDCADAPMASGYTITTSYNGATAAAAGDAYVILPQAVTESGPAVRPITPSANISATSTMSGSVGRQFKLAPAQINAASTVSGSVAKLAQVKPTSNIAATSTVSGAVTRARPIVPTTNISATSIVSGRVNALHLVKPTTNINAFSTMSGNVVALKTVRPTTNISATSTVSGAVRALHLIKPTSNISATSTVSGDIIVLIAIRPTSNISATSTVSGSIARARQIIPTSNILATSTTSGSMRALRAILPAQINAVSTVSGRVAKQFRVIPTQINATSTVSGSVVALRRIFAAAISATSTMSGSLLMRRGILPTQISATSTVSGSVLIKRIVTTTISATSTVSGAVSKLSGGPKPITPTQINATSTVSGNVVALRRVLPAQINATSTVSGNVVALRRVAPAQISATSTVSGNVAKLARIATTQISATSTVSGNVRALHLIRPTTNILATSTVSGSVVALRRVLTAAINATSTVSGGVAKIFRLLPTNISATSTVSGTVTKPTTLRPITPTTNILATSTVSGAVAKLIRVAGNINATSTVSGNVVALRRVFPAQINATSVVSGNVAKLARVTAAQINATSTVSGAVRPLRGILTTQINATSTVSGSIQLKRIVGTQINATSTVSGKVVALHRISTTQINATSTVSGGVTKGAGGAKPITPTQISATSTVSGNVVKLARVTSAQINATSTVSGSVVVRRAVLPTTNVLATSTVSGSVAKQFRVATTQINATSTVAGSIRKAGTVSGNIFATSTVSGGVRALRRVFAAQINATSTVSGAVVATRRIAPTNILATSTVSGSIIGGHSRAITPTTNINAFSTMTGGIRVLRAIIAPQISAFSIVSGSVRVLRAVRPAQINATSTVAGTIVYRRRLVFAQINATSLVSGSVAAKKFVRVANIFATSTVTGQFESQFQIKLKFQSKVYQHYVTFAVNRWKVSSRKHYISNAF